MLASIAQAQGQHRQARAYIRRAISTGTAGAQHHYLLGKLLRENLQFVPAISAFRDALDLDAQHLKAKLALGEVVEEVSRLSGSFDFSRYTYSDYDDDNALRWPRLLTLVIAYLSRHFFYPILALFSVMLMNSTGYDMTAPLAYLSNLTLVIASVPAIAVVFIGAARRADSGSTLRGWWGKGRWLMGLAALLDTTLVLWLSEVFNDERLTEATIFYVCADLAVLAYILSSARLRDTFNSFPFRPTPRN